jgi:hypothetical protein
MTDRAAALDLMRLSAEGARVVWLDIIEETPYEIRVLEVRPGSTALFFRVEVCDARRPTAWVPVPPELRESAIEALAEAVALRERGTEATARLRERNEVACRLDGQLRALVPAVDDATREKLGQLTSTIVDLMHAEILAWEANRELVQRQDAEPR